MSAPTTSLDNDESCTNIFCGDGYHKIKQLANLPREIQVILLNWRLPHWIWDSILFFVNTSIQIG